MRLHRSIPLLRIVPDDTKFDFMRFRRISFPISAILSIAAIFLYFFHGLNIGIDFIGGTLIEVQSKAGPADLAKHAHDARWARPRRRAVAAVRRADRCADPRRAAAGRRSGAAGRHHQGEAGARRRSELPPRRGGRPARLDRASGLQHDRARARDLRDPDLSVVSLRVAVRARRHGRQRARSRAYRRLHVADADRFRPVQHRGAAHHSRLLAQRHRRHLRPYPRDAATLQEDADAGSAQRFGQLDAVALDHHARHRDAGAAGAACSSAAMRSTASSPP